MKFFVCAYHLQILTTTTTTMIKSNQYLDKQNNATHIDYFDCNEDASNLQLL
jgi:hypothetical protein